MSLLYTVGQNFNLLKRANSVTVTVGGEDTNYPKGGLFDDDPNMPFRFNSLASPNCAFKCDLNPLQNPDLTTWSAGAPVSWPKTEIGTGTVTQLSPGFGGAGSAARLNGGAAGTAQIQQDITAKALAGEWWHFEFLANIGAASSLKLQVFNRHTNKYAKNDGTWTASNVDFLTRSTTTTGSYVTVSGEIQLEAFGGSQPNAPTLSIIVYTTSNANCDADNILCYPGVNGGSIHGHNLDSVTAAQLQKSTDDFAANSTTAASFTIIRPAFYAYLGAMQYARWWRFEFAGTNQSKILIGEAVLNQYTVAARTQEFDWETKYLFPQTRNKTMAGKVFAAALTTDEQRVVRVGFKHHTDAELAGIRDEWYRRSGGGIYPMIVVPYDADNIVLHGRVDDTFSHRRSFLYVWEDEIFVAENPFPQSGL